MKNMESEIKSFNKVWIASIASICYCYFIVRPMPRGLTRLLFVIPIFYLFITLPLNLSSFHPAGPTTFYLVWLANFKLLLFSFNQGPLSSNSLNCLQFISIALLPIKTKQESTPNPRSNLDPNSQTPLNPPQNITRNVQRLALLAMKVFLLVMVISSYNVISYNYLDYLYGYLTMGFNICHLYPDVLAPSAILAQVIPGLELEPQFDEPYLATSLQDFWGRRWNLTLTSILRPTVYWPSRTMFTRVLGRKWASLPAIVATFVVSGLMHELIFFYLTQTRPMWEVMRFFVLQGVCTAAEVAAKKTVGDRWQLHPLVSRLLTVGFVVVTGVWQFYSYMTRICMHQNDARKYFWFGSVTLLQFQVILGS